MKVKTNNNNDDLWCIYWKTRIEIGDKYIEVVDDCLGEGIVKTYSFDCLQMLASEYMDETGEEPEILFGDR